MAKALQKPLKKSNNQNNHAVILKFGFEEHLKTSQATFEYISHSLEVKAKILYRLP